MIKLQLELELDSDILDEVEVNGDCYYKLNERADVDDIVKRALKTKIESQLRYDFNGHFKEVMKEFVAENKDEIIEKVVSKLHKSIINTKEIKALKDSEVK